MFQNNINGNKNKVKIEQKYKEQEKNSNAFKEILIDLLVTVVGGILLYFIIGD